MRRWVHRHVRARRLGHVRDHADAIGDAYRDADTDADRVSSELLSIVRYVSRPFASSPSLLTRRAAVCEPVHVQRIKWALRGTRGDAHYDPKLHPGSEPGRDPTAGMSVCGFVIYADNDSDLSAPAGGAHVLDGDYLPVPRRVPGRLHLCHNDAHTDGDRDADLSAGCAPAHVRTRGGAGM